MSTSSPDRWDWSAVLRVLAAMMVMLTAGFGMLAFGGSLPRLYSAIEVLAVLAMVLSVISWKICDHPQLLLLLLPGAILLLGAAQLAAPPDSMLEWLAPTAREAQQACRSLTALAPRACVSMDPEGTRLALGQIPLFLLVMVATMWLVTAEPARATTARCFVCGLAVLGMTQWLLGWWFRNDPHCMLYGGRYNMLQPYPDWEVTSRWPPLHTNSVQFDTPLRIGPIEFVAQRLTPGDGFGSYPISNHFAGCLTMTLPFAMALCLAAANRMQGAMAKGMAVCAALVIALGAAHTTFVFADSRGGAAALLFGTLVTLSSSARGYWTRRLGFALCLSYLAGAMSFLIAALEGWIVWSSPTDGWQVWLTRAAQSVETRAQMWRAAWAMFCESPVLGIGLGGYATLAPRFARQGEFANFAHNEYAQFLAETGCAGLGIIAVAALLLWRRARGVLPAREPVNSTTNRPWTFAASQAGANGALAAICLQNVVEWNMRVPANALLAAIVVGLWLAAHQAHGAAGAAPRLVGSPQGPSRFARVRFRLVQVGVVAALICCAASAVGNVLADEPIDALRDAVEHLYVARVDRELWLGRIALLLRPAEEVALDAAAWNAPAARLIGQAYLELSDGRPSIQLLQARTWLTKALCRRPADDTLKTTLKQIDAVLEPTAAQRHP